MMDLRVFLGNLHSLLLKQIGLEGQELAQRNHDRFITESEL